MELNNKRLLHLNDLCRHTKTEMLADIVLARLNLNLIDKNLISKSGRLLISCDYLHVLRYMLNVISSNPLLLLLQSFFKASCYLSSGMDVNIKGSFISKTTRHVNVSELNCLTPSIAIMLNLSDDDVILSNIAILPWNKIYRKKKFSFIRNE